LSPLNSFIFPVQLKPLEASDRVVVIDEKAQKSWHRSEPEMVGAKVANKGEAPTLLVSYEISMAHSKAMPAF
jgi:hypothetical protein